jgi:hypothetical protein
MTRRALGIASAAYAAGVAAFAAFAIQLAGSEHFRDLYADEWVALAGRGGQPFVQWLFTSHNGHVIPVTRLLLHADLEWVSSRGALPAGMALAALGAAAWLVWLPVRASGIEPGSVRRAVGAFLVFCLVYGGLMYGLLWSFSGHAPLMAAWVALAVAALIAFAREDPPRRRGWLLALSLAGAAGASFACATGLAAWAALLAIAVAARLPVRIAAAIAAAAAVCALLVAVAPRPESHPGALASPWLGQPVVVLRFVLRYLGTPLAWPAESWLGAGEAARTNVAFAAGAIGLTGFLVHAARRLRAGRVADGAALLGLALMAFGIGAASLTAIARAGIFPAVSQRFTPFALFFWMGAVVAAAAPGGAAWRGRVRLALPLLLPLVSLVLLHSLGPRLDHHRERRTRLASHTLMAALGIRGDGIAYVLANSKHASAVVAALPDLEARGVGPFADPRRKLLGEPLAAAGIEGAPPACAGEIRERSPLSGRRGSGEVIEGTVRAEAGRPLPISLVVADEAGRIRGFGDLLRARRAQADWYAARVPPLRHPASVYAVFEDGSACVFGGSR